MIKLLRNPTDETNGTSFQGYIETTYYDLVSRFGDPTFQNYDPTEKVNVEWVMDIDGKIVTIYNWKTGRAPMGMYHWHIGGHDASVLGLVTKENFVVEID